MLSERFPGDRMELSWITVNRVLVVRVSGRLDITKAETFERSVVDRLSKEPADIVINLSRVTYMSSSGIGALLAVFRFIGGKEKKMAICEVSPVVKKLLDVVEIGQIFKIFDHEDDAIASFSSSV